MVVLLEWFSQNCFSSNTWHSSSNLLQMLDKLYSTLPDIKTLFFRCTHIFSQWIWTWTRCRNNPRTDKLTEPHSTCQTTVSNLFFQWVVCRNGSQITNRFLYCGLQRRKFHLVDFSKLICRNGRRVLWMTWTKFWLSMFYNSSHHCCNSVVYSQSSQTKMNWVNHNHAAHYLDVHITEVFAGFSPEGNFCWAISAEEICKPTHKYQN